MMDTPTDKFHKELEKIISTANDEKVQKYTLHEYEKYLENVFKIEEKKLKKLGEEKHFQSANLKYETTQIELLKNEFQQTQFTLEAGLQQIEELEKESLFENEQLQTEFINLGHEYEQICSLILADPLAEEDCLEEERKLKAEKEAMISEIELISKKIEENKIKFDSEEKQMVKNIEIATKLTEERNELLMLEIEKIQKEIEEIQGISGK